MGPSKSKQDDAEDEVQYYEFVRSKNKKDKAKHDIISSQKGTAYNKLKSTEQLQQPTSPMLNSARSTVNVPNVEGEFFVELKR